MKKRVSLLLSTCVLMLFAAVFFAVPAMADTEGDWEYTVNDNLVTITAYNGSEKTLTIPDSLAGYKVTAIGRDAFKGNISLESATFPDTIVSIGDEAFLDCSSLTEIVLSNSLESIGTYAFSSSKIKHLVIPDSVSYIGPYAFDNCTGLRSVDLGSGITEWGTDWDTNAAFRGCTLLTDLNIPEGITSIGPYTFDGCTLLMEVTIPDTVTEICEGAFRDCELLDTIDIWGSVGASAFLNCTSLKNVTLNEIYTIGDEAFSGNTALKEILLPDTLTSIGSYAFYGCTKLQGIIIPDTVTYVGAYTFEDCTQLESAIIGAGIEEWGEDWSTNAAFRGCTKLTDISISEGCTYIPSYCFENCTALEYIEIPGSCESIGTAAFQNCTALSEIVLNEGICYIYGYAFNEDVSLVKAELPSTLLLLDNYSFHNTRMREVHIPDKVMTIGFYAFSDNPALRTVYIGESVETWNIDWSVNGAFQNDYRLESVEIAEGCMYIGSYAFDGCSSLTGIDIPITATSVDECAFQNCVSLTHVSILRGEIGSGAFRGCTSLSDLELQRITMIENEAFNNCSALYQLELPDTVTTIGSSAFRGCVSLSELSIPESVTTLGAYVFADCSGLLTAYVSNNITEWQEDWGTNGVFANDVNLQYVRVDDGANSLGSLMFSGCTSLKGVYLPESVVSYNTDLFDGCSEDLLIYGSGSKMQALAEEIGRNYSTDVLNIPELSMVTLEITAGEGGIIAPEGTIEKPLGSSQAITIVPGFGYKVDTYTVNGYKYDYWDTLVNIQEPAVIEVTFVEDPEYIEEYPLLEESETEENPEETAEEDDGHTCPNCGYEFPEDEEFAFCPKCGTPQE